MSIREFPTLLEKAKVVESLKSSSRAIRPQMVGGTSRSTPDMKIKRSLIPYLNPSRVEGLLLSGYQMSTVLDVVGNT